MNDSATTDDLSFLALQEGCPYSAFNDPVFPPLIDEIKIKFPYFDDNFGRTSPYPDFANFFPGTSFNACVILTVPDDKDFEGNELFGLFIYGTGPDFYLPQREPNVTIITVTDPEGTANDG